MARKRVARKKAARKGTRTAARRGASRKGASRKGASRKGASRKSSRKGASRKGARKAASRAATSRSGARKTTRRARPRRTAPASTTPRIRAGVITHTELASADPPATRSWCEKVLGWKFGDPMPTPTGPYHMWRFVNDTGGGIRSTSGPENPGTIPYVEVHDIRATFSKALAGGATELLAPQAIPGNMGWIAIVAAPGGVPIGFWGLE